MKLKGWHFVAVADGAGSARLARIGSQIAVNSAIKFFKNSINLAGPEFNLQTILFGCLKSVYCSLETEARTRQNTINELATTLLLLAHNPGEGVDKIGVAQIGDGLIIVCHPTGDVSLLADPDQGQYAGETQFITHISLEEMDTDFNSRIRIHEVPSEKIDYILLMTDGIGDDFFPPERNIQKLVTHLHPIIACDLDTAQTELSNLIAYEKRASFDDRTLVMLTRNPKPSN